MAYLELIISILQLPQELLGFTATHIESIICGTGTMDDKKVVGKACVKDIEKVEEVEEGFGNDSAEPGKRRRAGNGNWFPFDREVFCWAGPNASCE